MIFALTGIIRILDLPAYGGRMLFVLSPIWECPGEAVYCIFLLLAIFGGDFLAFD